VRPEDALAALQVLLEDADDSGLGSEARFVEWRSKVGAVLRATFGASSEQVREFAALSAVKNEGYTTARGRNRDLELWRGDAASRGRAVLKSAIYTLETLGRDSPLDDGAIDPELWVHVQGLIADGDWAKVPAAVAIFVEDKVRTWAGDPRNPNDSVMLGKTLYARTLANAGPLRLGRQESESEGWRSLGMGLAQAVGNVDRHRIQQRADIRRYAMGVLGLGSLFLTQLRYEHPAQVQEAEAVAGPSSTLAQ
jgi:hypothetical protein